MILPISRRTPRNTARLLEFLNFLAVTFLSDQGFQDDVREGIVVASLAYARDNYGPETRELANSFFNIGFPNGNTYHGRNFVIEHFSHDSLRNPKSLNVSFRTQISVDQNRNVKVSKSLCILSMVCYRDDDDVRRILPDFGNTLGNVLFVSCHAERADTNLNIFVEENLKWAVFCFRGTEFESLRDFISSLMVSLAPFEDFQNAHVWQEYSDQLDNLPDFDTVFHVPGIGGQPAEYADTVFELIQILNNRNCKIYYTGHSLGGGLATLFCAKMFARYQIRPHALVTFGATAVGDLGFKNWFDKQRITSWRFVHSNEFAPMVPPFPFLGDGHQFYHVGTGYQSSQSPLFTFQQLPDESYQERVEEINQVLSNKLKDGSIMDIVVEHNPMYHILALDALQWS